VNSFVAKHRQQINGVLECFDRVILRGHLPIAGVGYFLGWLTSKGISLNLCQPEPGRWKYKEAAPWFADKLKAHAQARARTAGRPYRNLLSHERMEENAQVQAEQVGISDGLVCVYGTMEKCHTFRVSCGEGGLQFRPTECLCLVFYYYWMDREFGLMHVKIQTWFPFTIQVYFNGHEWLARKLTQRGIDFRKVDNAFIKLADPDRAGMCARQFWRRDWPKFLDCLASRLNPLLRD
jgi:hypothetical protein